MADTVVFGVLAQALSSDSQTLKAGEDLLKRLASNEPEFPKALLRIALAQDLPTGQRQISFSCPPALSLKAFIDTHWSASKSDRFVGPEPHEEVKAWVRANILSGLAEPLNSIRVAIAYAVSKIAHIDWPEAWPQLFDELMACLRSGHANRVHGAMRVLAEFVRDDISEQQFPSLAPVLMPELLAIFTNEQAFSPRTRSKAVVILRDFIEMIFIVKGEHPGVAALDTGYSVDNLPIKNEVLRTIVKIGRGFPKQLTPHLAHFMQLVWADLVRFAEHYQTEYISPTTLNLQSILFSLIEFTQLAVRKKSLKPMFLGAAAPGEKPFLWQFMRLALGYMRISTEMQIAWGRDMNQFIQDDEEESLTFNVRIAIQETLIVDMLRSLCDCTTELLQTSRQARDAGVASWWKMTEACLLALGRSQVELVEAMQDGKIQYDMEGLFNHIVLESMKSFGHPFLQGRALWFASQYAEILPKSLVSEYLQGAVAAIREEHVDPAVRVCAIKAIRRFCSIVPSSELEPYQAHIIEGIAALAPSASADSLSLLVETFLFVIKINRETTDRYEPLIATLVLDVWSRTSKDPFMADPIQDIFSVMATSTTGAWRCQQDACRRATFLICCSYGIQTALLLVETMLKKIPDPLSPVYAKEVLPRVFALAQKADDSALLQNSEEVLKQLVRRDFAGVAAWNDGTHSGLEYTIQFVAKLLDPSQSESAAMYIGDLITKLIQKVCRLATIRWWYLLLAVIRRLESARMPTFVQTLIAVFAHLIQTQTDTVVQFLAGCNVNGRDGLTILLNAWCDNFQDFSGSYTNKVSCSAMSKLLLNPHPQLNTVQVRGVLIVPSKKKIVTRSVSKNAPDQFTSVPFRLKAIQLLLGEHQHQHEIKNRAPKAKKLDYHVTESAFESGDDEDDEDDDGEGEWEDEDDEDDELGGGFDFSQLNGWFYRYHVWGDDDDEAHDQDPDVLADPLYHTDMEVGDQPCAQLDW
ncbi:armadillo-type protein [Entophlyctis helioformis]|nr:armadillo-type protein [Entophlyctis helioformis]